MYKRTSVLSITIATIISLGFTAGCGLQEANDDDISDVDDTGPADDGTDDGSDDGVGDMPDTDGDPEPECVSDDECPLGTCVENACVPNEASEPEPECASDEECADGEVCSDEGSCEPAPEPEYAPAPLSASGGSDDEGYFCTLHFGIEYISEATCGEARGNMPGLSWGVGAPISDLDGVTSDLELTIDADDAVSGTYDLSYLGFQMCGAPTPEAWAQYGGTAQLSAMSADAREFISCNWWDADTGTTVSVGSPNCGLKVNVAVLTHGDGSKECMFMPAGNMRDYDGE